MKKEHSLLGRWAPVLAAVFLLPGLAAGETLLFEDDFNEATADEPPTIPPWTIMTENDLVFGNYILVRQDWEDLFGEGGENHYMEFHGTNGAMVLAADFPESDAEVVTMSFDFFEPDTGKDHPLILFVYSGDGTARAERLRLTHGGIGASAPAAGSRIYPLDTVNRVDWIVNNSDGPITYLGGTRTIDSARTDVWINGSLVASNTTFEPTVNLGPIRGMDIRTFSGTPNQHVLIDNIKLVAGTKVRFPEAATTPLMEFLFEGNLVNTGSLGGEGTFVHQRESNPNFNWVWANRAGFGEGLDGRPNSGLDNTQVGGMGDYGQGEVREGGFFFPSDGLRGLQSLTIASWYKTPPDIPWSHNAFLAGWPNGMDYRNQTGTGNRLILNVPYNIDGGFSHREQFSFPTIVDGEAVWHQFPDRWTFQAVTFDGTTGTMSFYYGYEDSNGVIHNVTRTGMDIGPLRNLSFDVAFANSYFGTRPLKAHLDNLRVFGSTEDGSGALSQAALTQIWAADLDFDGEPPPPPPPTVRIVDMSYDGFTFRVSFETDPIHTYVVESSTDLINWSVIHTVEGDGTIKEHIDFVTDVERRFYRVRANGS